MKHILFSTLLLAALSAPAEAQVSVNVDASQPVHAVSPNLYGIFFEDINHAADGGLYAELIRNRSFEDDAKTASAWTINGAKSQLVKSGLLNKAQGQALQLQVSKNATLTNDGFWGINAVQGRSYRLSMWTKGKYKGTITARLVSADGKKVYAEAPVAGTVRGSWAKQTAELKANANDPKAKFQLLLNGKGTLTLDVVSLFPPTFKGRANGLRPDLAQMLDDLHPKFLRFPGGCFVEGQERPENAFHWEKTVGPIESRPGHQNVNWRYRTSDGMGFDEYLQLAEDIGAKPLYVVNVGIWHGGFTPVDSIQPWIDECMNALEYANGPVTSKYGALRAKNGHPQPYNIEYVEIGNENNQPNVEFQSDHYYARYKKFRDAILAKYPKMHLIGDVEAWGNDHPVWDSREPVELIDEHYYRNPAWFTKEFHHYDSYDRTKHGVYVGEYAVTQGFGNMGSLDAALGEAVYMMGLENNSDVVRMASYAPIFANLNNRMWAPDMIQFTSDRAFGTPSYYIQKMMADHVGDEVLKVETKNPYTYEQSARVKPDTCQVGVGTWATQASFKDASLTDGTKMLQGETMQKTDLKGQWTVNDGVVSQTSNDESCIRLDPVRFVSNRYHYHVKARKDGGNEGFLILFNYVDPQNYCWLNIGGWGNTQNGIEQIIRGGKGQVATAPGHVENGRWYDIDLDVDGDSVTASLDGKQIFATKLPANTLPGVFATATKDSKTGRVIVKIANTSKENTTVDLSLNGIRPTSAVLTRLSARSGEEENDIDHPTNVSPQTSNIPVEALKALEIPGTSMNIIVLGK